MVSAGGLLQQEVKLEQPPLKVCGALDDGTIPLFDYTCTLITISICIL